MDGRRRLCGLTGRGRGRPASGAIEWLSTAGTSAELTSAPGLPVRWDSLPTHSCSAVVSCVLPIGAHRTTDVQRATCSVRHAACSVRRAACDMQRATCSVRHAACDMQHATCSMRHAACSMRHAACSVRHATWDMQRAACSPRAYSCSATAACAAGRCARHRPTALMGTEYAAWVLWVLWALWALWVAA